MDGRGHGRPPRGWTVPRDQCAVLERAIDDEEDAGNLPPPVAARLRLVVEPLGDQIALMVNRTAQAERELAAPAGMRVVPYPLSIPDEAA